MRDFYRDYESLTPNIRPPVTTRGSIENGLLTSICNWLPLQYLGNDMRRADESAVSTHATHVRLLVFQDERSV